jgi:hypothetical protein
MPKAHQPPPLLTLRGTPEYAAWLDDLIERAGVATRAELMDLALLRLARRLKVPDPPRRAHPIGTNRFTTSD